MYVDDTDLILIGEQNDTTEDIKQKAQSLITKWCSSLWISGGCLRPEKCWWYMIKFIWNKNGTWRYAQVDETPAHILIPDENRTQQRIKSCETSDGRKTLGAFLAPDGNNNAQLTYMNNATDKWTRRIQRSFISRFSANISVRTTIMKTLVYPTAAITISEKECNKLMTKIKNAALPKMGINRKVGLKYLYGPSRYQGIAFPNLYTELCIERIKMLMKHGGQRTQIGTSITACLEGHQLEIGIDTRIFDADFKKYDFLISDSIIKHTWKILSSTGLRIYTLHEIPDLYRQNDSFIMKEIINMTTYSIPQIQAINRFRIHLQVVTLSDIIEGNGLQITENAYMGKQDPDRTSKWNWPNIPKPPKIDWCTWRGAIEAAYAKPDSQFLRNP
jgi:hypothetical protein